jgi:hypothetical protein
MDRRTALSGLGATILLAGCATQAARAQAPAPAGLLISDLSDIRGPEGGPYVVLIPTHEETRATPNLVEALQHLGSTLAQRREAQSSRLAFVADPSSGDFDAGASARAIDALNAAQNFGLSPSGGAILVVSPAHPTQPASPEARAWVFESNDPAIIASSISRGAMNADRHPQDVIPQNAWDALLSVLGFSSAVPKPSHPRP